MNGYIDAGIYIVVSSVAFIFLDKLCLHINPSIALFIMSASAVLFFNLTTARSLKQTYTAIFRHSTIFIVMSGSLAIDWVCMLYASHAADPFIAMTSLFISLAILGFIRLFLKKKNYVDLYSISLLIISLAFLYYSYTGRAGLDLNLGIILGVLAGIAFFIYIVSSIKFAHKQNLATLQILACRFWILFIGSCIYTPWQELAQLSGYDLVLLIIASFTTLIIPVYFNQQAINKLGAARTSIVTGLVPPVTFVFYSVFNHSFNWSNILVCSSITIALFLPKVFQLKKY